jgi:hypothetical protein
VLKLQRNRQPLKELRTAQLIQQESQLQPGTDQITDPFVLPGEVLDAGQDAPGVQECAVLEQFDPQLIQRKRDVSGIVPKCRVVVREPYPYPLRYRL